MLINNAWNKEANVIFISTTCFDEDLMHKIINMFITYYTHGEDVKRDIVFITLDKSLGERFEVIRVISCLMSWGLATSYVSVFKK